MVSTRVLFLCPYPFGTAAGQRFSYEQYFSILERAGIDWKVEPFLSKATWDILYKPGHHFAKFIGVLAGFVRRSRLVWSIFRYDFIYIFREASPLGPPIFEFFLFLTRRKVVYYFDDAIFIEKTSKFNRLASLFKWTSKIQYIVARCHKVAGANKYLTDWAAQFNPRVVMIPSTIDPSYHKPLERPGGTPVRPVIGWTGSHSTASYLDLLRPVLLKLQETREFEFRVICDVDPGFPELTHYRFLKWRADTEIEDLAALDIGVMPVPNGDWELGKVGFKAVQYSALGIPSVVSSTGSGREVILDGRTGFVVDNDEAAWLRALEALLSDPRHARELGRGAREHILANYSVPSQEKAYLGLFQ
jgi:glycosyltransferase involved in cell wall biosynthesis